MLPGSTPPSWPQPDDSWWRLLFSLASDRPWIATLWLAMLLGVQGGLVALIVITVPTLATILAGAAAATATGAAAIRARRRRRAQGPTCGCRCGRHPTS
jgi:hypothetical protein